MVLEVVRMDVADIIRLLGQGNQLKQTARTGWVQRGVPNAETVAAHSYGVAFTALLLAELVDESVDLGKLLALAVLHDLPEGLTTDIPTPAWRYLPEDIKTDVERGAMREVLADAPVSAKWLAWWEELHANETVEARLTHDADKIDMYLQAVTYEAQTGNRRLAEFWGQRRTFYFPVSQAIYEALGQMRG